MKIYEFRRAQVSTISGQTHAHTRIVPFVSAAGICIWCVTTNLQWHLHWQLSVYLVVRLSGCRCLFSLPVYLPTSSPPVPSDCLPVHVLVAAEQSLHSNETQNKFINFPVEICAVCTASVITHLSLPLLVSLAMSIDAGVTTEINWKLIS